MKESIISLGNNESNVNLISVILHGYCHIDSQRGRITMHVRIGIPGSEGGMEGAAPSRIKM